jgi:hypothetical protein
MLDIARMRRNLEKVRELVEIIKRNPASTRKMIDIAVFKLFEAESDINTVERILPVQIENAKKNKAIPSINLNKYKFKFSGKTVISIASGASLSKNIEELQQIQHKYKIVAADRSLNYLLNHGIKPKFVIALDAEMKTKADIDNVDLHGSILLAHIGCNHDFVRKFYQLGGRVCFFVTPCRINSHIELIKEAELSDLPIITKCGGCVGHATISFALEFFNCKQLILLGHDYSYIDDAYYSGINSIRKEEEIILNEELNLKTNANLFRYSQQISEYIKLNNHIDKIVDCSDGIITGIDKLSFKFLIGGIEN